MFHRFIVALFLLSAVCCVMSASVATLDEAEVAEKFEKDADLDESSKSVNETIQDIKVRDVTMHLTKLKANVTKAVSAANSTGNATSSAKSTKQNNDENTTPKVSLDCTTTTCSVRNGITTCKTTTNCDSTKLKKMNTTEKVTTPKAPVLDDALSKKQED